MKDETKDDRGPEDLTRLTEQYKREIDRLAEENSNLKTIEESHRELNGKLHVKISEVENEMALLKGIGNNSPEMRDLQKEVKELREDNKKLALQISDLTSNRRYHEGI